MTRHTSEGRRVATLAVVIALALLCACSSPPKKMLANPRGPSMIAQLSGEWTPEDETAVVGAGGTSEDESDKARRVRLQRELIAAERALAARPLERHSPAVSAAIDEHGGDVPMLPNPTYEMHVHERMGGADGRLRIPSYKTYIRLYDRDEFALASEIAPRRYPTEPRRRDAR